jgi:6-pyruvoyltetrahydropterin/6-carboxytetrahydropterin synthase
LGFKTSSSFRHLCERPAARRGVRVSGGGNGKGTVEPVRLFFTMPIVTATRRLRFNAAHRVHNPALSDEENTRLFGKCNNPNWHGHNYLLEVSVKGPIDERTGYVIDLGMLRSTVERHVVDVTDHRNFNIDVPYMQGVNPTTENVVVGMWRVLEPVVSPGKLVRLRLWETENNFVDYEGE